MPTFLDLLVVAAILGFAYRGWLVGLEAASVAALELLACVSVAVMLHETVAGFLHAGFAMAFGELIGQAWSTLLAFALLAWGSFALVRWQFHRRPEEEDESVDIDPLTDRLTGAVAGGFGGVVCAGGALVTLSMLPVLAGLKPSGDRMLLDVGKSTLLAAGQFARERHDGRSLPLLGEPPSRMAVATARLTSEPWFDADDDGTFTDGDRFRDVDGSGTFTKDLYFEDVDGDGMRRIGLVDKYVAGRWDGSLISNDRPRPDVKKPGAPATPPAPKPSRPAPPTPVPPRADKPDAASGPEATPRPEAKPAPEATPKPDTKPEPKPATETAPAADAKKPPPPPPPRKRPQDDF